MAPKQDAPAPDAEPEAAPEPAPEPSLVGAAYPTVRVHANVSTRGIFAGQEGDMPDDDETAALVAAGLVERV